MRFSTKKQADGDSYRRQTEAAEAFAVSESIPLDKSLHETDIRRLGLSAFSGSHIVRGPIRKFLGGIESGTVKPGLSVLLLGEGNRLTRQVSSDALEFVIRLLKKSIGVIDLQDRAYYTLDRYNNDVGLQIGLQVKISMAHQYSKNLSHNVGAAWVEKRRQAIAEGKPLTGNCPGWMILNKETGKYEIIPERREIVILIFALAAERGYGKRAIAGYLNSHGIPVFTPKTRNGEPLSGRWHHATVAKLLTNKAVIGHLGSR